MKKVKTRLTQLWMGFVFLQHIAGLLTEFWSLWLYGQRFVCLSPWLTRAACRECYPCSPAARSPSS
ncbi:unnamed protein product, partial [Amoebophrya sp. A25]|eukprot:GSA25T00007796001.1